MDNEWEIVKALNVLAGTSKGVPHMTRGLINVLEEISNYFSASSAPA